MSERTPGATAVETAWLPVRGELDVATIPGVVERFDTALDDRPERLVLDLRDVTFIDSSGIAGLIRCRRLAHRARTELVLDLGDGPVAQLIERFGLERVFATV